MRLDFSIIKRTNLISKNPNLRNSLLSLVAGGRFELPTSWLWIFLGLIISVT